MISMGWWIRRSRTWSASLTTRRHTASDATSSRYHPPAHLLPFLLSTFSATFSAFLLSQVCRTGLTSQQPAIPPQPRIRSVTGCCGCVRAMRCTCRASGTMRSTPLPARSRRIAGMSASTIGTLRSIRGRRPWRRCTPWREKRTSEPQLAALVTYYI